MNLWVPPRWLRRLVLAPAVLVLGVFVFTTVPLLLIGALVLSYRLPGQWRALRLLGFALVYLLLEVVGLVALAMLWVLSGFGWKISSPYFQDAHYGLLAGTLNTLLAAAQRLFVLRVDAVGPDHPAGDPTSDSRPLIVLSRHAGPGDSFLVLQEVMTWSGRRPRIVLKDTLQLDPLIDVLLNRLPNRFISAAPGAGEAVTAAIGELARTMTPADALVIFPEGGNYTPYRHARAVTRLRESGLHDQADRAAELQHTLPPRPGGVFAAVSACPTSTVVLVAHTGTDDLVSLRDIWRAIPDHKTLHMRWGAVPAEDLPRDREALARHLLVAWSSIDRWIADHRGGQPVDRS